jgi:hypothetical protein
VLGNEISVAVRRLIDASLATMDHVEMLLLLRAMPEGPTELDHLPPIGYLDRASTIAMLGQFEASGFVQIVDGAYRYGPSSADAAAIDELAVLFQYRSVALVQAIHARSTAFGSRSDITPCRARGES